MWICLFVTRPEVLQIIWSFFCIEWGDPTGWSWICGNIFRFNDHSWSSTSFGCTQHLVTFPKTFHKVNTLSIHLPGICPWHFGHWPSEPYQSCLPIPIVIPSHIPYHNNIIWMSPHIPCVILTNTLSLTGNSSTGYVRILSSCLSLYYLILWISNTHISKSI